MNSKDTRIFIFTLPQKIHFTQQQGKLICNVLVMPKYNPLAPLAENIANGEGQQTDFVPFAESDIEFTAYLVKGNEQLPTTDSHNENYYPVSDGLPAMKKDRTSLFKKIADNFQVDDKGKRDISDLGTASVRKYLPESYLQAYGYGGARQGSNDDNYFCELRDSKFSTKYEENKVVNWSQIMSFCLQQYQLAEKLGLLFRSVELVLPDLSYFKNGGWVYFDFKDAGPNSYFQLPQNIRQLYAAWVPPVTKSRQLFSPVLFPVEKAGVGTAPFDEIFDEVVRYNDGFAKLVHSTQNQSLDPIIGDLNQPAPSMDAGIRLSWDDEQILQWYNRGFQFLNKINQPEGISDTPLVVARYRIDAAEITTPSPVTKDLVELEKKLQWKSQVSVVGKQLQSKTGIDVDDFEDELGIEVSPTRHGDKNEYWLPVYFTNWNGSSLVLPDDEAEKLNKLNEHKIEIEAKNPDTKNIRSNIYKQNEADKIDLKYGSMYAFRVRLVDISGGGPGRDETSLNPAVRNIAIQQFKRFVAPQAPVINSSLTSITIERPRLNYPAILFTGLNRDKVIDELIADRKSLDLAFANKKFNSGMQTNREVSLPDPDVDHIEIVVEVKSLEMDREHSYNAIESVNPKEPYIFLYKTYRKFPAYKLAHKPDDDDIKLEPAYHDVAVMHFGQEPSQLGFTVDISKNSGPLHLPSGREIRLRIRACCKSADEDYFGAEKFRYSLPKYLQLRHDPKELESEPLLNSTADPILSIFFRPEQIKDEASPKKNVRTNRSVNSALARLAEITGLTLKNGSLIGVQNIRTQFGCSRLINHNISPDHTSLSFSGSSDLYNKWINVIQIDLNRDWTWDLLEPEAFKIHREWRTESQSEYNSEQDFATISLTRGLNWELAGQPDRTFTRLIFIDAFDPKPINGEFPEPVEIRYMIEPCFRKIDEGTKSLKWDKQNTILQLTNYLPITTCPLQTPRIASVGIALSASDSAEDLIANQYSETSERSQHLWIEFEEPPADLKDNYFGRVLAYAPDPMLATNDDKSIFDPGLHHFAMERRQHRSFNFDNTFITEYANSFFNEESEPELPIEIEDVRVIRPGQVKDQTGLNAMQQLIPALTNEGIRPRHFILPLPTGIYPDSEELFGFFTYEFRVGHADKSKWCTAQGRFGPPLRVTGIQHPFPTMILTTKRTKDKILIGSRHARSFYKGKNVTPAIPRTDIYALLYAQVLQSDGIHYRNILIDQLPLLKPRFTSDEAAVAEYERKKAESEKELNAPFTEPRNPLLAPGSPPTAISYWNMKHVREKLRFLGISINAPLSVMVAELMPPNDHPDLVKMVSHYSHDDLSVRQALDLEKVRILRTSRLYKVADTCPV